VIAAHRGDWLAHYCLPGPRPVGEDPKDHAVPVIAWDEEGYAMVVDTALGKLVRACDTRPYKGQMFLGLNSPESLRDQVGEVTLVEGVLPEEDE
jgi:hypothetical protein